MFSFLKIFYIERRNDVAENYYTILTNVGKAKIANAQVLGEKVVMTHLAVGDGNGMHYNPTENQTALRNEVWRGHIGSIDTDLENPNWIVLEATIPSNAGGFNVREVGIFDDEDNLIAIGKYPETYKPILTEGSAKDLYVRMIIEVTNAASVQLKIDPTIAMPSRKWVEEEIEKHAKTTASLTQRGHVQLSDDINSTSTTEAATPSAVKAVNEKVTAHLDNKMNPHSVTSSQVGAIPLAEKGKANGVASLGSDGKVPASQLSVTQPPDATTSRKGIVQLNTSTSSTSTTQAATPSAVKSTYDYAQTISNQVNSRKLILGGATATGGTDVLSFGYGSNVSADQGIALGYQAKSKNQDAIAIGSFAQADNNRAIAIGRDAKTGGNDAVAIGNDTYSNSGGIALGDNVKTEGSGLAVGRSTGSTGTDNVVFGINAKVGGGHSNILIGVDRDSFGGDSGGIYIDPQSRSSGVNVIGTFNVIGGTKNFMIPHPKPEKKATHYIRHGAVESPTPGENLYRYFVDIKSNIAHVHLCGEKNIMKCEINKLDNGYKIDIPLPDYWIYLNKNPQVKVNGHLHFETGYGYVNEEKEQLILVLKKLDSYHAFLYATRDDENVQDWYIKGVERHKAESWNGEVGFVVLDELLEVQEILEEKQ